MSYKVKQSGWVYWLHKEFDSEVYGKLRHNEPVGLCLFFWNTIFQMFKMVGVSLATLAAIGVMIFGIFVALHFPVGLLSMAFGFTVPFINYEVAFVETVLVLAAGCLWILVEIFLKLIGSSSSQLEVVPSYIKKVLPESKKKSNITKQPSLVVSYWQAFKDKVCPLVELDKNEH